MDSEVSHFGDCRVDAAGRFLHDRLVRRGPRGISVRSGGGSRAGEVRIGRFLRTGKVTSTRCSPAGPARRRAKVPGRIPRRGARTRPARGGQARWITRLYRRRWTIEQLFRTIKTKGFDIEAVSREIAPFRVLCAMTLVAGVSCLQRVQDRDALEAVSATLEGKTEKQKNPHPKGSLAFAAWVCARLGGWTGYYGKPGPVVMLHGLYQFRAIQRGYQINHDV